jgi:carbonic anhydrase
MVGYKLSKIQLYKQLYSLGFEQFIPFIATIIGVLFTDLLRGIGIGMAISVFYILRKNFRNNFSQETKVSDGKNEVTIHLSEEVTFLNKGGIQNTLNQIPKNTLLTINGTRCKEIDYDVLEIIQNFKLFTAKEKNIELKTINIPDISFQKN